MTSYAHLNTVTTRVAKEVLLRHEEAHKTCTLEEKEMYALSLIEMSVKKMVDGFGKDVRVGVQCSFGVDSVVVLHLVRRVASKFGVAVDIVWGNTLNEYPQTRKFAKELTEAWGLRMIEARPNTTIKKIYEENGVDSLLKRKGDRSKGQPIVEKCCNQLKHAPMIRTMRENKYQLMFNGVRAGESRIRWMSGRRDGDFYFAKSWNNTYICRPILWWTSLSDSFNYGNNRQEDVWEYVKKYDLPYNPIYDLNAVIDDRYEGESLIVGREHAEQLVAEGINVFMPRTGCQACPIPIRRGYLRYLREVFPRTYRAMLFQLGFAKVLIEEMAEEQREALLEELNSFGIIDEKTEEAVIERLEEVIEWKPCVFDNIGVVTKTKRKKSRQEAV